MKEVKKSDFPHLRFMRLESNQVNMPATERECLMNTFSFGPYSDAYCEEGDDWKEND